MAATQSTIRYLRECLDPKKNLYGMKGIIYKNRTIKTF